MGGKDDSCLGQAAYKKCRRKERTIRDLPGSKRLFGFRPDKEIWEIAGPDLETIATDAFFFGVYPLTPTRQSTHSYS